MLVMHKLARLSTRLVPLLVLTGLMSCGDSAGRRSLRVETTTVGDTLRIFHRGALLPTDTLILDLQIGELEGEDGVVFGLIEDVEPTPDGGVLVFDAFARQVFLFGRDGQLLNRVGGWGEGPGEYRYVNGLAVHADGRILVRSPRTILVYTERGEYLEEWPIPVDFVSSEMLRGDRLGHVAVKLLFSEVTKQYSYLDIGFLILAADGSVIDTVGKVSTPWDDEMVSPLSVYPGRHVAWSPLGYPVAGVSSRLAFQIQLPDGRVILSEFPVDAVPFRPDKRAQWEEEMEWLRQNAPMFASQIPQVPVHKPIFRELLVANTGEIWLRLSTPSDPDVMDAVKTFPGFTPTPQWKEPLLLAVFDTLGHFVKAVKGTSSDEVRAVVGDTVWAIRTGPYDEQYVVRLVAEPLGAGGP